MTAIALVLYAVYVSVTFGVRTWLLWRRTGDTGFRGISGRPLSVEWWAGVLFVVAVVAGVLGPVLGVAGLGPVRFLAHEVLQWLGLGAAVLGIAATFLAQLDMGVAWRIGVDETERTELVTTGVFAWVRNPIFTAMILTGVGLTLMVPNAVALFGLGALVVAIYLQVAVVEEPYLRRVHGQAYVGYAQAVGRFLPRPRRV